MNGHVESYLPCRICAAPIPEAIQRHIVERYPRGVYLAPYPSMTPRVALTTLGRVEALDGVDEARITAFIDKHL